MIVLLVKDMTMNARKKTRKMENETCAKKMSQENIKKHKKEKRKKSIDIFLSRTRSKELTMSAFFHTVTTYMNPLLQMCMCVCV